MGTTAYPLYGRFGTLGLRSDFRKFRCYSYGYNYATIWAGKDALRVFRIDPKISFISDR